jgi:hypothetical protein
MGRALSVGVGAAVAHKPAMRPIAATDSPASLRIAVSMGAMAWREEDEWLRLKISPARCRRSA